MLVQHTMDMLLPMAELRESKIQVPNPSKSKLSQQLHSWAAGLME
jgi:hypothetical protein